VETVGFDTMDSSADSSGSPSWTSKKLAELGETEQRRTDTIQIIRQWFQKQPHLEHCQIEDGVIVDYARGCKYSIEKIKNKLEKTLTMKQALPEFFKGWNPSLPELQAALKNGCFLPLLEYDQLGRKVIISRPGCFDPYLHKAHDIEKANFMVSEIMGTEDEEIFFRGLVMIIDMEGYSLGHMTQRPLAVTKNHLQFLQDAAPLSPKGLNFIRTGVSFSLGFNLCCRLGILSAKMKERVKVHGSDFKSLHKVVDQKILPTDYGGSGLSIAALTEYWKNKIENSCEKLNDLERFKSHRLKQKAEIRDNSEHQGETSFV